jgi:hypothetical protein
MTYDSLYFLFKNFLGRLDLVICLKWDFVNIAESRQRTSWIYEKLGNSRLDLQFGILNILTADGQQGWNFFDIVTCNYASRYFATSNEK